MLWMLLASTLAFAQTDPATDPIGDAVDAEEQQEETEKQPSAVMQAIQRNSPTIQPLVDVTESVERPQLRVILRAVAEQWNEPAIATVYQQGGLLGGIGIVIPIWDDLALDVEFVYRRFPQGGGSVATGATGYQLQVLPITFVPEYKFALNGPMHGFVGFGAAYTVFSENAITADSGLSVVSGARLATEVRTGIRLDPGLMAPHQSAIPQAGIQAIEIEIYGARRMQLPRQIQRLDLGAWRGCIGLGMRF